MQIEVRELSRHEWSDLKSDNHYGFKLLELKSRDTTPPTIVKHVDYVVKELQNDYRKGLRKPDGQESVEIALGLGAVWGNQIVRELGWEWVCIKAGGQEYCVVTPPDRSLFIAPAPFVKQCFDTPDTVCTILYVFDLLNSGTLNGLPENSMANVMVSIKPPDEPEISASEAEEAEAGV